MKRLKSNSGESTKYRPPVGVKFASSEEEVEASGHQAPIGQVSNGLRGHPCRLLEKRRAQWLLQRQKYLGATRISTTELLESIFVFADVGIYIIKRICPSERYECNSLHR
jgi:hypothetical protein